MEYLRRKSSTSWSDRKKLTHVIFDEIKISKVGNIDRKLDQIVGPAKNAQFVMARGLCENWKWIVFCDFDYQIDKDALMHIIVTLEVGTGLTVMSTTCDQG